MFSSRLLLHGKEWRPVGELSAAETECYKVADACDVTAVVAEKATKDAFLKHMRTAAVLHMGRTKVTINPCGLEIRKWEIRQND